MLDPAPAAPSPVTLAVVSDTHGHAGNTAAAVAELERRHPDVVIHCGDIGSTKLVPLFAGWPTHFVFGNVDGDGSTLQHAIAQAGLTCHGDFGTLNLAGVRIAFLHGHDEAALRQAIRGGGFDLVCHGHTHRRRWETVAGTRVLNPGALFRATPHTFALVTLPTLEVEFVELPG